MFGLFFIHFCIWRMSGANTHKHVDDLDLFRKSTVLNVSRFLFYFSLNSFWVLRNVVFIFVALTHTKKNTKPGRHIDDCSWS